MKKQSNLHAYSEKLYAALLKLFPRQYQDQFGHEMLLIFHDMLKENSAGTVWMIAF
jgi:hypothetical protein